MGYIKHLAYCDWPCRKFCLQGCKLIYGVVRHTKLFVSERLKDSKTTAFAVVIIIWCTLFEDKIAS